MKKVAVIIVNWNGINQTLPCVESIRKSSYLSYHVFVADNGSTDDSIPRITSRFPEITLIDNKANLGFAEGNNKAISLALSLGYDFFFLLNNDTVIEEKTLEHLIDFSETFPDAIIGAKPLLFSKPTHLDHIGGTWNPSKLEFDLIGFREDETHWNSILNLDYVTGCSMFLPKKILIDIGLFDPRFFLYWEESDLCFRAKKKGYQILFCPNSRIHHKVSASFIGGKPHTTYFFWRNRYLWIEKNLSFFEKIKIFPKLLTITLKALRHYLLKSIELTFLKMIKKTREEKALKHKVLKASVHGIMDFARRRFYQGPKWLYNYCETHSQLNNDTKN